MTLLLGSHVSLSGKDQYVGSVKEAIGYGANVFMVYTGAPQNTIRKPISELQIPEAKTLMLKNGIDPASIIVHAPYIVNLANPDPEKHRFAVDFLSEDIRRTAALGAKTLVLHPGAHMNEGPEVGIANVAEGINQILENTKETNVTIALETMAGKGTEVGCTFDEIAQLIAKIQDKSRIGVCYDTCHTHDAGYDVIGDFDAVIAEFDRIVGISYLRVLHVNDSKNPQGAHKDRHENIGFGAIGFATLVRIINDPRFAKIPKILETPYIDSYRLPDISYPPYQWEIAMIKKGVFDPALKEKIRQAAEAGS